MDIVKNNQINVELNPHYKPNEVSIQCGSTVYSSLPFEYRKFQHLIDNGHPTTWIVSAIRTGTQSKREYVYKGRDGNYVTRFFSNNEYYEFKTYKEARAVADKMIDSGFFRELVIKEKIKLD